MIEFLLIIILLLLLLLLLNPWQATSRRKTRPLSTKSYWQDGGGY